MALKPCRECGKEISDQAETCPHCGIKAPCFVAPQPVPQTPHEKGKPKKLNGCLLTLGGFLAMLIGFAVIAAIGSSSSLPPSSSSATPNAPATQSSAPTTPNEPAWKEPLPGTTAILGDDGGGADSATVCDTSDHYNATYSSDDKVPGCRSFLHGLHVVIKKVMPDASWPLVEIEISSKQFVGFTAFTEILPVVPIGTIMHLKQQGNGSLTLAPSHDADLDSGINLGQQATAKVVRYEPINSADRDFYVTILDGKYAGSSGWVFSMDGKGDDGEPLDMFLTNAALTAGSSSEPAMPAPNQDSPPEAPSQGSISPVFIGNKGQVISGTMGCPNLDDIKTFETAYAQSQIANDQTGQGEAVMTANDAGCNAFSPGAKGLVIATSGFLEGYDKVRMDSDSNAFWVPREAVGPIPGEPNNP